MYIYADKSFLFNPLMIKSDMHKVSTHINSSAPLRDLALSDLASLAGMNAPLYAYVTARRSCGTIDRWGIVAANTILLFKSGPRRDAQRRDHKAPHVLAARVIRNGLPRENVYENTKNPFFRGSNTRSAVTLSGSSTKSSKPRRPNGGNFSRKKHLAEALKDK